MNSKKLLLLRVYQILAAKLTCYKIIIDEREERCEWPVVKVLQKESLLEMQTIHLVEAIHKQLGLRLGKIKTGGSKVSKLEISEKKKHTFKIFREHEMIDAKQR